MRFSSLRRRDHGNGFPLVPAIDAEIGSIDRDHAVTRVIVALAIWIAGLVRVSRMTPSRRAEISAEVRESQRLRIIVLIVGLALVPFVYALVTSLK